MVAAMEQCENEPGGGSSLCDSGPMNQAESGSNILKPPLYGVV